MAGAWDPRAVTEQHDLSRGARSQSGAHDNRLHPKPGAAVRQTPARETTKHPQTTANGAVPDAPVPDRLRRTRVCVLCGQPLRAGQPMLRIQGSTIHARCSSASRSDQPRSPGEA
jgi:hypothetical protein